ncbi:hypothetical protein KP806_19675 [Paenibacillus sp. N4]|uniref:hypothetical protein n=1 Tax=Paenibacillus vietnamensis TaxID=2590547 RepID=UPI001CD0E32A|nr:hypothetical protein [Paenibacillus vietnamensis]MCA0757285.1 hypothetical protein [Paenibacillus vietnamensis]
MIHYSFLQQAADKGSEPTRASFEGAFAAYSLIPELQGLVDRILALFAGRLILAYNRILFPCHKSLMSALEKAPDKPDSYMELQHAMLTNPTKETIGEFVQCIGSFHAWGITMEEAVSRFVEK